ncbi:5721_t:CDS:1 [Dentiscutata heterogama]|uniref:5721_t:CDS:1 n=1 Tax=Dentiscutata heterogama TaxID=1316150 RepID=A0ACA9L637_9GLOM|nr:5721_t:CDS:1 [Dentiscutata heterogama]
MDESSHSQDVRPSKKDERSFKVDEHLFKKNKHLSEKDEHLTKKDKYSSENGLKKEEHQIKKRLKKRVQQHKKNIFSFNVRKMNKSEIMKWIEFCRNSNKSRTPSAFLLFKSTNKLGPKDASDTYNYLSDNVKSDYDRCAEIIKKSTYEPETAYKMLEFPLCFFNYDSKFFKSNAQNCLATSNFNNNFEENLSHHSFSVEQAPNGELIQDIFSVHVINNMFADQNTDMSLLNDGNIVEEKRSSLQLLYQSHGEQIQQPESQDMDMPQYLDVPSFNCGNIAKEQIPPLPLQYIESDHILNSMPFMTQDMDTFNYISAGEQQLYMTSIPKIRYDTFQKFH